MKSALLQYLGSAAFATIVVVVINAIINRRKLGSEVKQLDSQATEIITKAASGVVADLRQDNQRLREENRGLEQRVDELEAGQREWEIEREEWRRVLQVHTAWDALAISAMASAKPPIDLPDVPPLTPPTLPRRDRPAE